MHCNDIDSSIQRWGCTEQAGTYIRSWNLLQKRFCICKEARTWMLVWQAACGALSYKTMQSTVHNPHPCPCEQAHIAVACA